MVHRFLQVILLKDSSLFFSHSGNCLGEHEHRGRRTSVYICVNDVGVHLINRVTKLQEYSFSYQQMTFTIETEAQSTLEINVKDNKNVDHTRLSNSTHSTHNKNFKNSIFSFSSSNKHSHKIERSSGSSSSLLSAMLTNSLNNNEHQQRNNNRHILYTKQNFLIYHLMSNFAQEQGSFL